jgi:hypothetical protein
VEVWIEDVEVLATLRETPEPEAHARREAKRKRMRLDADELEHGLRHGGGGGGRAANLLGRIGASLLDHLRIFLVRVHVRFEHGPGDGLAGAAQADGLACGVALDRLEFRPAATSDTGGGLRQYSGGKLVSLSALSIYCEPRAHRKEADGPRAASGGHLPQVDLGCCVLRRTDLAFRLGGGGFGGGSLGGGGDSGSVGGGVSESTDGGDENGGEVNGGGGVSDRSVGGDSAFGTCAETWCSCLVDAAVELRLQQEQYHAGLELAQAMASLEQRERYERWRGTQVRCGTGVEYQGGGWTRQRGAGELGWWCTSPFQEKRKPSFLDQPASGALGRDAIAIEKSDRVPVFCTGWNGLIGGTKGAKGPSGRVGRGWKMWGKGKSTQL